ncbi:MAG: hypothetical protein Fur0021_11020 [Candidatus Promineifilaceae bacterium]
MNELVQLVVDKTGISESQAEKAIATVLDFLKQKLPASIAGQIDGLLKNGGQAADAGDLVKGLGSLLGKK